jgi:hypothetical protein
LNPIARMQYEMEDSIEESQNCTVEESVRNWWAICKSGVYIGNGERARCRMDYLTDERR